MSLKVHMNIALNRILTATTIEGVWEVLLLKLQSLGFQNALYGFTRFHTESGFGDTTDHLVLTNLGPDYVKGYFYDGRYKHGPLVTWAAQNAGVCSWAYVDEVYDTLDDKARETVEFNRSFGVTNGYTIGFNNATTRSKGAIGLSMSPFVGTQEQADTIWNKYGQEIRMLCEISHLKIISLPFDLRRLTTRQREVLEWVGDGKTSADVAQIMGLTTATVEKHLKLARDALDVETTAQAILKASLLNQFYRL
ncbi:LuxR family transcriptional regulator [Pacificibacter sp. 1_MG-2023]|nr:LuxR family transcriptional regulator [Pacificibacter sp. 1_MG-2023]